jgi:hypothetical protein
MTRARMTELQIELEESGWNISNEESGNEDLFLVSDEKIKWYLYNESIGKENHLTFFLFDYLGRVTDKLSDILYVEDEEKGLKLYFDKINSKEWKSNLRTFVRQLY